MATNPNNCSTCNHRKNNPDGGWCYMFKHEPERECMQHTLRKGENSDIIFSLFFDGDST